MVERELVQRAIRGDHDAFTSLAAASADRLFAVATLILRDRSAAGPLEHSHWFTADGGFGSHDQDGEEVDGGDFAIVDEDTLSFPSHSAEFGYDGEIQVDFEVRADGLAIFTVQVPEDCDAQCQDAHGWALSAFSSGPWSPGDVP